MNPKRVIALESLKMVTRTPKSRKLQVVERRDHLECDQWPLTLKKSEVKVKVTDLFGPILEFSTSSLRRIFNFQSVFYNFQDTLLEIEKKKIIDPLWDSNPGRLGHE